MTPIWDHQANEVGRLQSKHQRPGRALAEALDRTRSSREGTPRTMEPSLPYGARSRNYLSVLSDSAAPNVEAGNAEKTVHMDLPHASPVRPYYVSPHSPSSEHPSLPTHDTESSSEPQASSHRSLQIPSPYSYPYPPSSAPPQPLPHHSEGWSEDEGVEEASEATDTDPGSEQLDAEEASSEEADKGESIHNEGADDGDPTKPHSSHTNSPPQSTSSSEAMLKESWHCTPSSPAHPLQAPTFITGGSTAIERLDSRSKPAQVFAPRTTRPATPFIPRGPGLSMRGGVEDNEGVLQLGISSSLKRSFSKGAFRPPVRMGTELMRREMGY